MPPLDTEEAALPIFIPMRQRKKSKDEIIIGLGTGRCGTQSFAKMYGLPHERYRPKDLKNDVAPYYIEGVEYMNSQTDVLFVCLRRDKAGTVESFVRNDIMDEDQASKFYDEYYARAEEYAKKLSNFRIFATEALNRPDDISRFIGIEPQTSERIAAVCPLYQEMRNNRQPEA